jgi:excisionase family DNA binding protein
MPTLHQEVNVMDGKTSRFGADAVVSLDRRLLTARDVSTLLRVPVSTVYELTRGGRLPCLRIGRAVRFSREDLEAHLASHRGTSGGAR